MTAEQAIQLYRDTKASRLDANTPATRHTWQDVRRKPVPGGFRIYPIPTECEDNR